MQGTISSTWWDVEGIVQGTSDAEDAARILEAIEGDLEAAEIDPARYVQLSVRLGFPVTWLVAALGFSPVSSRVVANFLDDTPGFRVADHGELREPAARIPGPRR